MFSALRSHFSKDESDEKTQAFDSFWETIDVLLNSVLYVMLGLTFIHILQMEHVVILSPESVKLKNQISSKVSLQAKNKAKSSHSKCTQKVHENWKTPAFYAIIEVDKSGIGCGKNEL